MTEKENSKKSLITIGAVLVAIIVALVVAILIIKNGSGQFTGNDAFFNSDGTKLVIPINGDRIAADEEEPMPEKTYLVYYYAGNTITKYQTYQVYNNEDTAKKAFNYFQDTIANLFEDVSLDGHYVILTHEPADYEWITAEDIKQQIEYINTETETSTTETEETEEEPTEEEPTEEEAETEPEE